MKSVILTDCFDTIVKRSEHPFQVQDRWAQCLVRIYPDCSKSEILAARNRIPRVHNKPIDVYGIHYVYKEIFDEMVRGGGIR